MFHANSRFFWTIKAIILSGLLLPLLLSTGCASSMYGKQTVKVHYYADCYQPINQLRRDADSKAGNAAAGAVIGGILGGVIGYQSGGGRSAAIGAISGAFVGAATSYLITDQVQKKSQSERFAAYSKALDEDISGFQNAVAAARLTAKCYQNSYKTLEKSYKAGQIGREEMVARLTEIRDGTNDANTILTKYSAAISDNQIVYNDIQKNEAKRGTAKTQLKNLSGKQQQLSKVSQEAQNELKALQRLNDLCGSQLQTITAGKQSIFRLAVTSHHLFPAPSAGH